MKNLLLLLCMCSFIGCSPKKRSTVDNMDDFIRPVFNSGDVNRSIDAVHGKKDEHCKEGVQDDETNNFNNTAAQNIIMYSGMQKEIDAKQTKNCYKNDDVFNDEDYKHYYNEDNINHLNMSGSHDYDYFNEEDRMQRQALDYENMKAKYEKRMHEKQIKNSKMDAGYDINMHGNNIPVQKMHDKYQLNNTVKSQVNKGYDKSAEYKDANSDYNVKVRKNVIKRNKNNNKKYCIVFKKRTT
ncbi:MAG: hypothetical protein AAFO15_01235 [Pseudomonadota bacterium]